MQIVSTRGLSMGCILQGGATLRNSPSQLSTKIQRSQSTQVCLPAWLGGLHLPRDTSACSSRSKTLVAVVISRAARITEPAHTVLSAQLTPEVRRAGAIVIPLLQTAMTLTHRCYADTLHRFCKKEHDWGWKKFMELNKVLEGFTVSNTLVIKAQVQVIRYTIF